MKPISLYFLPLLLFTFLLASCSKDKDPKPDLDGDYPRFDEEVEYAEVQGILIEDFKQVDWQSNTTYLLQCGQIYDVDEIIGIPSGLENITISATGNGKRPIIRSSISQGTALINASDHFTLQGIIIETMSYEVGCFTIRKCTGGRVEDCCFAHGRSGVVIYQVQGFVNIDRVLIEQIWIDGIYIMESEMVFVQHTKVADVNLGEDGGDCIQFDLTPYFIVHQCLFDHSSRSGKHCLFANQFQIGIVQNSKFYTYTNKAGSGNVGASFAWADAASYEGYALFRGNTVYGGLYSLHARRTSIAYDNVFFGDSTVANNLTVALGEGRQHQFYNNIVLEGRRLLQGYATAIDYHDNIFVNSSDVLGVYTGSASSGSHNCTHGFDLRNSKYHIAADPLFMDKNNEDFRLQEASPCIGAGSQGGDIGLLHPHRHGEYSYEDYDAVFDSVVKELRL